MMRDEHPKKSSLQGGRREVGRRRNLRITASLHLMSTVLLIAWNYVANAGVFDKNVGEVSRELDNVFTPASFAFGIWGPIYLGLLALGFYEVGLAWRRAPEGAEVRAEERFILILGPSFVFAQTACGLWLVAWLTGAIFLSLAFMSALLVLLLVCLFRTQRERRQASSSARLFLWWPLSLYSGWISVAFLANVSAYLAHLDIALVQEPLWAVFLAGVVVLVHAGLVWLRDLRAFSMVGAWALFAIFVRHGDSPETSLLSYLALAGVMALLANAGAHAWRSWRPDAELRGVR